MSYDIVGKPTPMISAWDKVSGKAQYTDDLRLPHPLFVKILRSPHASADIVSIDTTKAANMPGVRAILTGQDFRHTFGVLPISKDEPALARGCVRYVGEPVVAVAAETWRQAMAAIQAIIVAYKSTKACLDPEDALLPTEHPIHPELQKGTNLHKAVEQRFGDPDQGLREAACVVEGKFSFASVTHAFLEPHAVQVAVNAQQHLTVYSSTQVPHYLHLALAEVLDIPQHQIRVIKPFVGSGFGGKSDPFPHEMIAAKMALVTGRNIRLCLEREEVFFSHHGRHPTHITMKLGIDPMQGVSGLDADILIDGGAYASFGVVTTYYNGVLLHGPYRNTNMSFRCRRVYTNKPMCGAMRGHGGVNPRFAFEVLLDMACETLAIDPCEFRLNHFLPANSLTASQFRITSTSAKAGLMEAMRRSRWADKFGKLPYGRGIGVASGFFISGSALPIHWNEMPQSVVRLTIDNDGSVSLFSGAADIGQGSDTMLAQLVAEVLGLPLSLIHVVSADTQLCPIDYGSYSSRVTFMAGNAARNAAIQMRRILLRTACQIWNIEPPMEAILPSNDNFFQQGQRRPNYADSYLGPNPDYSDGFVFRHGTIFCPSDPERCPPLAYAAVLEKAMAGHGALQSQGVYISPQMGGTFKGSGAGLSPAYSFTSVISEVSVDPETGFIRVERVTCAHDCGQPLNPQSVEGQLEGSIHMGLGQALMEEMRYSQGAVQNASFLDYKILSPFEQPEIDLIYNLGHDHEGPFGAKEVGEGALAPVAPSVANAIYHAVGVRCFSLPMTPDRLLHAIHNKTKRT